MSGLEVIEVTVAAVLISAAAGTWWLVRRRHQAGADKREEPPQSLAGAPPTAPDFEFARRIIIGPDSEHPAFEISLAADETEFELAKAVPGNARLGLLSRMGASLQAVPSLLVQQAHQGRHLMEVVINNPLANAANGSHFLPFARGADGRILEQAKLFKPEGLNSLVNASAVWQVASVVVAQKHLADISEKLDQIKQEIVDLKDMFQDRLDGDIEGTYRYLRTVARTFAMGEVPEAARPELETCRRELLQVESSLIRMFERRVSSSLEHKETVGTGDLLVDTMKRYDELDKISGSLATCFKTQILAWHVLSLFPGEEAIAHAWKAETLESMDAFEKLQGKVQATAGADARRFESWFNLESTLKERRSAVMGRASKTEGKIERSTAQFHLGMTQATHLLEHNTDTIRLGISVVNGEFQEVRVLA